MSFQYAGRFGPEAVTDKDGNSQLGVSILVLDSLGAEAVLYTDAARSSQAVNPVLSSATTGNFSFYADPGDYQLTTPSGLISVTVPMDPRDLPAHVAASDPHGDRAAATAGLAGKVAKVGDTMSGDLAMGGHRVTGLADPAGAQDAATKAHVAAQIAALVNSAPAILDTLGEIATQLQSDESAAAALLASVALKAPLASPALTGTPLKNGSPLLSQAELNGAYAPVGLARVRGNRTVAMGDSITSFNGTVAQSNPGWFFRLCASSLGRINPGDQGVFATGGYTLADIQANWLPTVLALNPKPGAAIVFGGTNDCGASIGTAFDFAASRTTLEAICSSLMAAGIMPILVLIPPRGDDGTGLVQKNVTQWNSYVYLLSQRAGYPLFDAFTPVVDPTTGGYVASLTIDQVHPNQLGHQAIADYNIAEGFLDNFEVNRPYPSLYGEFYNLVPSGRGLFLTNSAGLGTGWSAAGGGTGTTTSILTPQASDNLKGNWQRLAQAAGGNSNEWIQVALGSAWTVGDLLSISLRLRASGFNACNTMSYAGSNPPAGTVNYSLGVLCVGASSQPEGPYLWTRDLLDGTIHYRLTVPVGTTSLFVRLVTNASSVNGIAAATALDIGEVTVRNLTTLGLVTL